MGWDSRTPLTSPSLSHMRSSQPSSGGDSGMKSQSAPEAKPDTSARYLGEHGGGSTVPKTRHPIPLMGFPPMGAYPQWRPITSSTNVRWWLQG